MFLFYIKKLIRCPATYIAAFALFLSMVFSVVPFPSAWPLYLFQYATDIGVANYFIPVASVLPICYVRHALQTDGAWQFPLMHTSPRRYSVGGLLAACTSGALVMLLALVMFFLFTVLAFPGPVSFKECLYNGTEPFYRKLSGVQKYGIRSLIFLVNGAVWAAVAYGVSSITSNQYLCASAPFVLYIGLGYLIQTLHIIYPEHWIYPDPMQLLLTGDVVLQPDGGLLYLATYALTVFFLCGILFHIRLKRRLKHG